MIDFANAQSITIPEGEVAHITCNGEILWQKPNKKYKVELEYLESTGTQWIDTGKYAPVNTDIEVRFQLNATTNGAIFGGRSAQTSNTCTLFYLASTNPQYFRFDRSGQVQVATANQISIDTNSVYKFSYKDNTATITNETTGEEISKDINTPSTFTSNPIQLFAVGSGTVFKGKIFEWKYWENGVLIQHLIPVLDNDYVSCMYDKVSGGLFYNEGTGEFKYNELSFEDGYTQVEYLESTGTQWIDTGYSFSPNIEYEFSAMMTQVITNAAFLGQSTIWPWNNSGNSAVAFANASTGKLYGVYNNSGNVGTQTSSTYLNKRFTATFKNLSLSIDGVELQKFSKVTSWTNEMPTMHIFNRNTANGSQTINGAYRYYYLKLYDNGILIRDFIPCVRNTDGKPGMYDLVTETFFTNQGTGEFLYA